ncbi:PASTA domain-containing protein [Candidatus Margulisiibacteriota bacterium]
MIDENISNNFKLIRQISEDDLGTVYFAEQQIPPQKVLVKIYPLASTHPQLPDFVKDVSGEFPDINLYKDDKALYAVVDKKEVLKDLYNMEFTALENLWHAKEKELSDIEHLARNIKKKIQKKKKSNWLIRMVIAMVIFSLIGLGIAGAQNVFMKYLSAISEIKIPDVRNYEVTDAIRELKDLGLEPLIVAHIPSQIIDKDAVISLFPAPGRIVKAGRKIKLKISTGKAYLKVPNLIGRAPQQVSEIMKRLNLGLAINEDGTEYSYNIAKGMIISQNIAHNTKVGEGETVTVSLSRGFPVKLSAQWDTGSTENCLVKVNCFLPPDWEETNVKVVSIIPPDIKTLVLDNSILPGGAINKQFNENYKAVIEVYYNNELAYKQSLKEAMAARERAEVTGNVGLGIRD